LVHVTNSSARALEAWQIRLMIDSGAGPTLESDMTVDAGVTDLEPLSRETLGTVSRSGGIELR